MRVAVFDFDGTLVDSDAALIAPFEALGVPSPPLGLPLVEVAELLEIPAGTARSRLHYAIAGLRDALVAEREPVIQEGRLA